MWFTWVEEKFFFATYDSHFQHSFKSNSFLKMNWSDLSSKNAFSDEKTSFVSLSPSQSRSMKVVQELKKPLSLKDKSQILAWSCYGSKTKGLLRTDCGAVVVVKWLSEMTHKLRGPRFASCKFQTFTCYLKISFSPNSKKGSRVLPFEYDGHQTVQAPKGSWFKSFLGNLWLTYQCRASNALTSLLYPCSTQKCRYILYTMYNFLLID